MNAEIFKSKTILLGISGGIAAYKICELTSKLKKAGAEVHVIMTPNAEHFVSPLTLETLSGNRVIIDMFDRNFERDVKHISLAKKADVFVVAPATANIIAKMSAGIADDFLSTTALAFTKDVIVCPAMNSAMLNNPATQANIAALKKRGYHFLYGGEGLLACGDVGSGRMAEPQEIFDEIEKVLTINKDFEGKTVLVTAGATQEDIDGVRCITNYSSGKMGIEIALAAKKRGANVILICGKVSVNADIGVERIDVVSTNDMYNAVKENYSKVDIMIMAAAPCDYTIKNKYDQKIKSQQLILEFEKNVDIAAEIGKIKGNRKLVIFAAETNDLIKNALSKKEKKNADIVIANDVKQEGAGFNSDTNIITIINNNGQRSIPKTPKSILSHIILDEVLALFTESKK